VTSKQVESEQVNSRVSKSVSECAHTMSDRERARESLYE